MCPHCQSPMSDWACTLWLHIKLARDHTPAVAHEQMGIVLKNQLGCIDGQPGGDGGEILNRLRLEHVEFAGDGRGGV